MLPEQIQAVNSKVADSWNHGIFVQPSGIPVSVKEPVFYWRHETGGVSGGSCWDSSDPQPYYNSSAEPEFQALDAYLELYQPGITFMQYKRLMALARTNSDTDYEYYGNYTEYAIKYILVSDVERFFSSL